MTFNLKTSSISWALDQINRHGDTDMFPVPFEYELLHKIKPMAVDLISKIDLETHSITCPLPMFSPKHTGGYRAVAQYNPIDCIIMTAFIGENAEPFEALRVARDERKACAYRIKKEENGDLFDLTNGWKDFYERSREAVASGKISHVLVADIADFDLTPISGPPITREPVGLLGW